MMRGYSQQLVFQLIHFALRRGEQIGDIGILRTMRKNCDRKCVTKSIRKKHIPFTSLFPWLPPLASGAAAFPAS